MCCRHCSLRADTKTWLALLGRAHGQKQMRSSAVAGRQLDARLGLQEEIFQDAVIYFPLTDLCRDKEGLWVEKPGASERTIYTTSSSFAPPHHPLLPLLSNLHMLLSPSSSSHPSQLQLLSSPKRLILISSVQFFSKAHLLPLHFLLLFVFRYSELISRFLPSVTTHGGVSDGTCWSVFSLHPYFKPQVCLTAVEQSCFLLLFLSFSKPPPLFFGGS